MAIQSLAVERAVAYNKPPPAGSPHSVPVPGSKTEGRSEVYRHWRFKDELLQTLDPAVRTAHDFFEQTANAQPKAKCLAHRPYDPVKKTWGQYVWQDYGTIQKRRANFGAGLVHVHKAAGVTGEKYGVGLWCQNRPEWQITDLAAQSQSLHTVSIYDTLGPDTTEYIINHASLPSVVTSVQHIPVLLKLKPRLPGLKIIISLDLLSEGEIPGQSKKALLNELASDMGVKIYDIADIESLGTAKPLPYNPPSPSDIITINYTSGTTGNPKGVVLTHAAAVAATSASMIVFGTKGEDIICSFLPLAHIFQRVGEHTALWAGGAIAYFHGDITALTEDLKLVRPTSFSGVPRLYNRFGGAIKQATVNADGFRGKLSSHVVSTKLATINDSDPAKRTNTHALYDRIWSKRVSAQLGLDRCRFMVTGSAPLDPSLHQFLRVVFSNTFVQGYGLTETYAVSSCQLSNDFTAGNCGALAATSEACLRDVPDMEYLSTDKPFPRGELLLRCTTQFREYHGNPEETAKAVDSEGWFHTGDICAIDELGRFRIVDRVKNVLKLAQGEYVSPERIENVFLANCPWLATAYVHGDSHQSSLVALFGFMPDAFAVYAGKVLKKTFSDTDYPALIAASQDPKLVAAATKDLEKVARKNKFNSWERVRKIKLYLEPFTVENELLTPTLKLKRFHVAQRYRKDIDALYEEVAAEDASKPQKAML
ncbi:long-chain-fatty-acid-CoA ligase/ protein binding protein [Aulographum hederae CBS 113979]|uniref:Long-chain-fatty-acid-CoA ligase/ protein binding protein n=1 Tax=Aulographum hederae CBS 113979 TaxID=1176131 RepID=A0A6G1HCX7_9PEZI|nr:long-chain-fatty-acid-CoA ligase/ protein binding protein [Aulographum hederae CBS 113979]